MASGLPVRQIPSVFARRQTRVYANRRHASTTTTQNPIYPLYPSVIQLLHEKSIPESEVSKIPASGPKGRLLKGDVLAYLGSISADYPSTQAAQLAKLSHLDLTNIRIAAPRAPAKEAQKEQETAVPTEKAAPRTTSVAASISLAAVLSVQNKIKQNLGTTIPLSTFLARATDLANDELPRGAGEKKSQDELFEEILGASELKTSRGEYVPDLNAVEIEGAERQAPKEEEGDIIDFLSGKKSARKTVKGEEIPVGSAANVFSLTVPMSEEKRAKVFLERIKTLLQVEPGRLVL